ncbi:MAG: sigma-70 family RNA polymerase sigma factor [Acidimicrobiia bacterium]|nr:sigma-70 family RNA polymerase sigma factor [Acidimicrobiia bacterium]
MPTLPPFQQLLDAHALEVHRFLRGLVGPDSADDCLQDALLSALRAYPRLRNADNLRAWLFTIAHRKGIDHLRRNGRERPAADMPERAISNAEPPDHGLWNQVAKLPDKQRAAITLRYVGDMTYATIAEIIDCSEPAARQNVRAGLTRLRKATG